MKKAFTLIELIIAIVIIGIAASALPTMIASANKLEEETINQDVFFKSITVITDIASRYWDASIAAQDTAGNGAMVVNVQNADRDLSLDTRPGSFGRTENDFRKFYTPAVNASAIPTTGGAIVSTDTTLDNIEAYNARTITETALDSNIMYSINVAYVPDVVTDNTAKDQTATWNLSGGNNWTAATSSTNLKRITVTASGRTVAGQPMSINFVYFSSNIGTPGIKKQ